MSHSMKNGIRPLCFLLILGTSWGLYFSLLKAAVQAGISYAVIALLSTGGICTGMLAIAITRKKRPRWSRHHIVFYFGCAMLGYLMPMLIELFVVAQMPASVLVLIVSLSPLATLCFAWIMKTDDIHSKRVLGIILGGISIFVILFPDAYRSEGVALHWLVLATLVPISYALYHNYIALYWPDGSDSWQIGCGETCVATFLLIIFTIINSPEISFISSKQGYYAIAAMIVIGLIDVYLYFELVRLRGPIYVSHAGFFMVVSGVLWGMVFFDETPSSWLWLSVLLLIISLYLISSRQSEHSDIDHDDIKSKAQE